MRYLDDKRFILVPAILGNRFSQSLRQVNLAWRFRLHALEKKGTFGRRFLIKIKARSLQLR